MAAAPPALRTSFKNPMAGGMLEYDDTFNEMLTEDRKRCRCTNAVVARSLIVLPTLGHWVRYVLAMTIAQIDVTDSEGAAHPIYLGYTHQFVVSNADLIMQSTPFFA
jgi:hypothetical protein